MGKGRGDNRQLGFEFSVKTHFNKVRKERNYSQLKPPRLELKLSLSHTLGDTGHTGSSALKPAGLSSFPHKGSVISESRTVSTETDFLSSPTISSSHMRRDLMRVCVLECVIVCVREKEDTERGQTERARGRCRDRDNRKKCV